MDELERELEGGGFLRCHKSYLVQERYVRGWKRDRASLGCCCSWG